MHFSKKLVAIIALVLTLIATNVVLAVFYFNRDVSISGGVATQGNIEVYDQSGETLLTAIDFPEFSATSANSYSQYFFVENIGNVPVVVYWDLFNRDPDSWSLAGGDNYYIFTQDSQTKYQFTIYKQNVPDGSTGYWRPITTSGNGIPLDVGETAQLSMDLFHNPDVNTPGRFSFLLSFRAYDA